MRARLNYRYSDKYTRSNMELIDLEQKETYIYSLIDEIRNSLSGVEEMEYDKFASTAGWNEVIESLNKAEDELMRLAIDLKAD